MDGLVVRDATEGDWPGIARLTATSFGSYWHPETVTSWRTLMPNRASVVVRDGDDVVGMAHYLDFVMTVPGGAVLPAAGLTMVGVAPTHRRRGLLREMYAELHDRIAAGGYPLAVLTASEGGIYGRFGYGAATTETTLTLHRRFAQFHSDATDPGGVRLVGPREHRDDLVDVYERFRLRTPGGLARPAALWDDLLADWEDSRGGGTAWFCLLHPDGYALYRTHGRPRNVRVEEFRAATSDAHVALWRALAGLDLVDTVTAASHPADPLPYLFDDARVVRTTGAEDELWVRIMDVPAALSARTYATDLDVVLAVSDQFRCDGGTFALTVRDGRATCVPTDAPVEITMGLDVLGCLYLGVHSARTLAAANRIRAASAEQLVRLDVAFGGDVPAQLGFHF